jgi:hypothetical protein
MFYAWDESRRQFHKAIAAFVKDALTLASEGSL